MDRPKDADETPGPTPEERAAIERELSEHEPLTEIVERPERTRSGRPARSGRPVWERVRDDATPELIASGEWLEERTPAEPGGMLYIELDRGAVAVSSHDANEVSVLASARGWSSGMVNFSLQRIGADLQLDGDVDGWFPALFGARVSVEVRVPREFSVDVQTRGPVHVAEVRGSVAAHSAGGKLDVRRVQGPVLLRTSGGPIDVEEIDGDVRARTSGGRVSVRYVNGDVEARTSGGSIRMEGIAGEARGKTSGGSVSASFVDEPSGRLETSGGSIDVLFPEELGADLHAKTSGGRVRIDHEITSSETRRKHVVIGQLNGGGLPLTLKTSGGSIRVRAG